MGWALFAVYSAYFAQPCRPILFQPPSTSKNRPNFSFWACWNYRKYVVSIGPQATFQLCPFYISGGFIISYLSDVQFLDEMGNYGSEPVLPGGCSCPAQWGHRFWLIPNSSSLTDVNIATPHPLVDGRAHVHLNINTDIHTHTSFNLGWIPMSRWYLQSQLDLIIPTSVQARARAAERCSDFRRKP